MMIRITAQALCLNSPHRFGSTVLRQPGILMHVHPVPPGGLKFRNPSFPGPDRMDNLMKAHS